MYKLRLLAVLTFVLVLGASLARGQDGTDPLNNQDKQRDHKSAQDKPKTNSNDSHRKHWWSPPHWFHKKHDSAAGQAQQNPFSQTGAGGNATTKKQTVKAPDNKMVAAANTPKASSTNKTITGGRPTSTAVARTDTTGKGAPENTQNKKTTATTAHKKTMRHDCTAEQAKKGACAVDKGSSPKGTTKPS